MINISKKIRMNKSKSTPDLSLKTLELENEGNKYICKIQTINQFMHISIYLENLLAFEGSISLPKIQNQIMTFFYYNINEIFEEIKLLDSNNFSIIKENDKNKLQIKFIILRRKQYLYIDLNENKKTNLTENDLINHISELKEIIKMKDNIINKLEVQLNNYKNQKEKNINEKNLKTDENVKIKIENLYNNFNIKLRNPIHKLSYHTDRVYCLTILKDGRLVSGSKDKSIIIYNKETFKPDLTIKAHNGYVSCITTLSSGILASCSADKTIKLFNIKNNGYNVLQTLNLHTDKVYKIIELKNKYLASCSDDQSIKFYIKYNNEYIIDYQVPTNGGCTSVIQTKDNEICYSEKTNNSICFFDLNERKIKSRLNNIIKNNDYYEWFIMINKDLLLIPGANKISIINVNKYTLIRIIDVPNSSYIAGVCMLNENMLVTGDWEEKIKQWKIEGDNLVIISQKEKTTGSDINVLMNSGNGHIISGADDMINIW